MRRPWTPRSTCSLIRCSICLRFSRCSWPTGSWHDDRRRRQGLDQPGSLGAASLSLAKNERRRSGDDPQAPAGAGADHRLAAGRIRGPVLPHHHRQDRNELVSVRKNSRTALILGGIVAAMVGLAFASVPLYRIFCEFSGFDGTPARAASAPGAVAGQVGVRFDANIHPGLPWRFEPEQTTVRVKPGAPTKIFYRAQNLSARDWAGQAAYN